MTDFSKSIARLPARARRGSRQRCLLLTHGPRPDVAHRLTTLVHPYASVDHGRHIWMPRGFDDPTEARLGRAPGFLTNEQRESVLSWWLAIRRRANTPNWDIAITATIDGREGLILVEAKAHSAELSPGGKGAGNAANHARIGATIREANVALDAVVPGWSLSRDSHYQLANRFAWAWKVASLSIPVILVYLGFLRADEMSDQGDPFADQGDWERVVRAYAEGIVPASAWETRLPMNGGALRPLLRSLDVALPPTE